MAKRDYYDVLGVSKNATDQEIKSNFRKLSMKWHPDKQNGKSDAEKNEATKKFQEIAEAYEVLSDKDKRANYDQFGFNGPQMNHGGFGGFDINDFMRRHGGMFGSFFGGNPFEDDFGDSQMFGNRNEKSNKKPDPNCPENGRDMRLNVEISLKDAIFGKNREFTISHSEECPKCHGTGVKKDSKVKECPHCHGSGIAVERIQQGWMISISHGPCRHCNATGYVYDKCDCCHGEKRIPKQKKITIDIPAGIDVGQKLRVKGMGEVGTCGGSNGDLYLHIAKIKNSSLFERNGLDLSLTWPIDAITASIGGEVDVITPYGYEKLKIPAGTKSGDSFVISRKGINTKSYSGNLHVNVVIEPLCNITNKQKELLDSLHSSISETNLKMTHEKKNQADLFLREN